MAGGRAAFDAMLAGNAAGRPAWLPIIDELAGRVQSRSYRETTADPDLWGAGLTRAGELLGADALVVGCEATLGAEACGAELDWSTPLPRVARPPAELVASPPESRRQAAMLEVLRRLRTTARGRFGVVAATCGPLRLATQVSPALAPEEALRRVKVAHGGILEALLATRPDLMLLMEQLPEPETPVFKAWQRAFGTLRNLAGHYDVPLALLAQDWSAGQIAGLATLRLPVYLLGRGCGDALQAARALATAPTAVGVPLPLEPGNDPQATLDSVAAARAEGCNCFLTTAGGIGGQGDLGALRDIAAELQRRAA
ncbi:MAG: uroporphyrinogen decarboxylase family protein [Steroidobacteraceae bacterium]